MTAPEEDYPLEIRLLGEPVIQWQQQPLAINRRSCRALLFYLASAGKPMARADVMASFWGDLDEENARSHLRTLLSKTRKALPHPDLLTTHMDLIALDFSRVFVDQTAYEKALDLIQHQLPKHADDVLPAALVAQMEAALSLWHGASFMTGFDFSDFPGLDEWLSRNNHYLSTSRLDLAERLALHYQSNGNHQAAVKHLVLLLAADDSDIRLHMQLIKALVNSGDKRQAQRHYNTYCHLWLNKPEWLADETMQAISETLFPVLGEPSRQDMPHWNLSRYNPQVWVQCDEAWHKLHEAFAQHHVVVLMGESGNGKTRLVRQFYESLDPSLRLFLLNCRSPQSNLPSQPLIEALHRIISKETWNSYPSAWQRQLKPFFQDYVDNAQQNAENGFEANHEANQRQLFNTLHNLLRVYSQNKRLIFVLDDAQWVDQTTLAAMAYLLNQNFFDDAAFLILTVQTGETPPDMQNFINEINRYHQKTTLTLRGFNHTQADALVRQSTSIPCSESFIKKLVAHTGGNPYFIQEVIGEISESTAASPDALEKIPIPATIQDMITLRWQKLHENARKVLACAAILGVRFNVNILAQIAQTQPDEAFSLLVQKLTADDFIHPTEQNNIYRFNHHLVREIILALIPPVQTSQLHLAAAQVLSAENPQNIASAYSAVVAQHYQAAGETHQAFTAWLQAGQYAWRMNLYAQAIDACQNAEALLQVDAHLFTAEDIHQLYAHWALAAYEKCDTAMLHHIGDELIHQAEKYQSLLLLGVGYRCLSDLAYIKQDWHVGLTYAEKAVQFLEHIEHPLEKMRALTRRGILLTWLGRFSQGIASHRAAIKTGKTLTDPRIQEYLFYAGYQISLAHYAMGDHKKNFRQANAVHTAFYPLLRPYNRVVADSMLALANLGLEKYDQACAFAEKGVAAAETMQSEAILEHLYHTLGRAECRRGNLDRAYTCAERLISLAEKNQRPEQQISGANILIELFTRLGEQEKAWIIIEQVKPLLMTATHASLENRLLTAWLLIHLGQVSAGQKEIEGVLTLALQTNMHSIYTEALLISAVGMTLENRINESRLLIKTVQEKAQKRGLVEMSALSHSLLIDLTCLENPAMGLALCRENITKAQEHHWFWHEIYGLTTILRLLPADHAERQQHQKRMRFLTRHLQKNGKRDEISPWVEHACKHKFCG